MRAAAIQECAGIFREMTSHMFSMARSLSHEETVKHWIGLIANLVTIRNKLLAGARGDNQSQTFANRITNQMRNDPLLSYAHAARGAEEHGIAVGHANIGGAGFIFTGKPWIFQGVDTGMSEVRTFSSSYLQPVVNHGRTYYPPTGLNPRTPDNVVDDPSAPANVGCQLCYLVHYWLEEAKQLPAHT